MLFWTVMAALAAAVSAIAALGSVYYAYILFRATREPHVVVYACSDPRRQTLILIKVENLGNDVATDIVFTPSRPIPSKAYGISAEDAKPAQAMTTGPLSEGVKALGPRDSRVITWGQMGGLLKAVGDTPIEITVDYKHGRRKMRDYSRLEVRSFVATDDSENPLSTSARALEDLSKQITLLARLWRSQLTARRER